SRAFAVLANFATEAHPMGMRAHAIPGASLLVLVLVACGSTSTNAPVADGGRSGSDGDLSLDASLPSEAAAGDDAPQGSTTPPDASQGTSTADAAGALEAGGSPCPGAKPDATN